MKKIALSLTLILWSFNFYGQKPVFTLSGPTFSKVGFNEKGDRLLVAGNIYNAGVVNNKIDISSTGYFAAYSVPDFKAAGEVTGTGVHSENFNMGNAMNITASVKGNKITFTKAWSKDISVKAKKEVKGVIINHAGTMAVSFGEEPVTYVWNTTNGQLIKSFDSRYANVVFSNDDKLLSLDGKVFDASTFAQISSFSKYQSTEAVAISNDGKYIAVGYSIDSKDKKSYFIIGNIQTGQEVARFITPGDDQTNWATSLAFSPDSKFLASGCDFCKKVHIYNVSEYLVK